MAKRQLNIRVSDLAHEQFEWLVMHFGASQTEAFGIIVDRIYQKESRKMGVYIAYPSPKVIEILDEIDSDGIRVVNNSLALNMELESLPESARQFFENGKVKPEYIRDLSLYMSHRIWSK